MKLIVDNKTREIEKKGDAWELDGALVNADLIQIDEREYHMLLDGVSYRIHLAEHDREAKAITLVINGRTIVVTEVDRYTELLSSLGMSGLAEVKAKDVKAPMPGLVLEVAVEAGQAVNEGDTLLVLEAMKMENVIKATTGGTVNSVGVSASESVEKGQVLVTFDS